MPLYTATDTLPPPTTILPWVVDFPLDDLDIRTNATTCRAPTNRTLVQFYETPERGIRLVWDPSVNDRLLEALNDKLLDAPVPFESRYSAALMRNSATGTIIRSEAALSMVMKTNFFDSSSAAILNGLPTELGGSWQLCPDSSDSGVSDWMFEPAGDSNAAIIKLKLPSVLTTAGDPEQEQIEEPSGNSLDDEEDGFEDVVMGKVHLRLKLEKLVEASQREEGLRLMLMEKPKGHGLTLRVLDENGDPDRGMSHWAYGLSQLWEQLLHYDLELVTLSSYNVWIPFERDTYVRNILRMGEPIHRRRPGTAAPAAKMSPMQLSMAVVIPRPPTKSLGDRFSKLPVFTLSGMSIQKMEKQKEENMKKLRKATGQDAASGRSKRMKRGRGQTESDGAGYGALSGYRVKLLAVALQVTVLKPRNPAARHLFFQGSLDDSDLAGCILSTIATPLSGDSDPTTANLALVSYLGSGRLWDAYAAVLTGDGLRATDVIAKVSCPYTYDQGNPRTQELFENSREALHAYRREAALYRGALAGLQGGAVPLVYGSFEGAMCLSLGIYGGFEIFVELMEDVGEPAGGGKDLRNLPLQDKLEIEGLYRQLHAVRVLHRDVEPRHIRRRANGRFAIIDFDSSREVKPGVQGDRRLASELSRVRHMLGLHDLPVAPTAASMA